MKVLLLSRYSYLGASSRLRTLQYIPYLESHGIEVIVSPLLDDNYIKDIYSERPKDYGFLFRAYLQQLSYIIRCRRYDLLWIEKELFPFLPAWGENFICSLDIPYVVDYDDAIFHNYDLHKSRIIRAILGKKIDKVMKKASLVIAGNDYLADRARKSGAKRIEYIPTVIDLNRYHVMPQPENKIFTIGWIGSPVTAKYLRLIQPALAKVCKDGKARMILVGSGQIGMDSVPVKIREWSEETESFDIGTFDVGIMPLFDSPWEQGKCGYKLIQCMACGKPVIASSVGVNQQIVEEGVNGFLVESIDDWVRTLKVLQSNRKLREDMGKNGRIKVEKQYCLQVTAPRLLSLLQSVVKKIR